MTPDLAELRRLAEAVPMPGDDPDIIGRWWDAGDLALYPVSHRQDREFIQACSPDVVLALLDERDALAAKVERVRALHRPAYNDAARSPICPDCDGKAGVHPCGCWADTDYEPVCAVCNEGHKGMSVPWPCETIRAFDGSKS